MSDDYGDMSFEDLREQSLTFQDIFDRPDINDYLYDYEPEWGETWDLIPFEGMTESQIEWTIQLVLDYDGSWDELWADMMDDFWDWFDEQYNG